jgi:acyl dehydratase
VTVEELTAAPRLGTAYRRAVSGALRRGAPPAELPNVELVLSDVTVDRNRLAEYDRVCGFTFSDALPGTYPHVLAFPLALALMSRPDFPLPLLGLVHVANRIEVLAPLRAADRFKVKVRAEDLRPHERGRQVDLVAEAAVDGRCVWRGRSTYLHRARRPDGRPTERPAVDTTPEDAEPPPGNVVWRVPADIGRRYAAVSGDRNPIHTSRLAARAFGFRRAIAHGMWTKARCLAMVANRLPDAYTIEVAFKRPVLLPATVRAGAEPLPDGHHPDRWRLSVRDRRSGRPHLLGEITSA